MLPRMPIIGAVPSLDDAHCTGQPNMDNFARKISPQKVNFRTDS